MLVGSIIPIMGYGYRHRQPIDAEFWLIMVFALALFILGCLSLKRGLRIWKNGR